MDVHKCYLVVTFLLSLQCTDAGGSCQENVYLEVGKQGVVSCDFEDFHIIGWIHGTGDVTGTSPFIYMEGSQIYGEGYESGDYDMHPNGSLIINEVKLTNKFNYTVLLVPLLTGANEYFEVPVNVYGGSCQENIYLEVGKQGVVSCHFENFDIIGWINGSGDVTNTSPFIYMEGSQIYGRGYESGDYDMHPNGSLIINEVKLTNEFNYTVLFVFHPAGANKYFKVPVKVYVPPDPGYPVVNGRTNQVVIHGNTRGFINCSLTGIRPRVDLEWVASSDKISLNSEHRVTDNSDGTYNTYLTSSYKVVNSPTGIVSIICRVAGQMADLLPSVTTVYLLLEQRFPVVNGLANQQHVVLDVNREGELTCSMDKVSQDVYLELVNIFPDSSDEILLDNKHHITANGDDTVNITLTSSFWVLSDSTQHFTIQCRVSGQEADKYPEATTVELLVTEIQELEDIFRRQQGLTILIVVVLLPHVILFWLIVLWMKIGKDCLRKHMAAANPGHQTDLEEAGAAGHQSIQEMLPLQPVNNEDNIDVTSQHKEILQKCTALLSLLESLTDSGLSSGPNSSMASGDLRELEASNAQDIEADVC